jgi:hypothetical protein
VHLEHGLERWTVILLSYTLMRRDVFIPRASRHVPAILADHHRGCHAWVNVDGLGDLRARADITVDLVVLHWLGVIVKHSVVTLLDFFSGSTHDLVVLSVTLAWLIFDFSFIETAR